MSDGNSSGRVLQVGVLDGDDVAGRFGEAAAQRGALALVPRLQHQLEAVPGLELAKDLRRAVSRSVVDHDQLDAQRDREHPRDDLGDRLALVEDRHHDAQERVGELASFVRHGGRGNRRMRQYYTPCPA